MSDYVTKQDLKEVLEDSFTRWSQHLLTEMDIRFGEVNQRLDRMDATLTNHGRQIAAGTKAIAGLTEWVSKADGDYTRVIAELTDLKIRVGKLEAK